MSLDEKLRSGLRTIAEPVQDSERALYAFKEKAYPRRARRRVFESVGAVLAAGAILAGSTAVVRNLSKQTPSQLASRPPGMPTCTNDTLKITAGFTGGPVMAIETAFTSLGKECWIDDRVRLTISSNGFGGNDPLASLIQGNGSVIRVRGVVPVGSVNGHPSEGARVLGARWGWKNYCGKVTNPFFEFTPLSDAFSYTHQLAQAPRFVECVDRSKPSELVPLGQVAEMNDATPFTG